MSKARQLAQKPTQPTGRKNLIINGAMTVAQRGTQTTQTSGYTACDRWQFNESGATVVTTSQDTNVPTGEGFANSLKVEVTTAVSSPAASNYAFIRTKFEGQDLQSICKGTSGAKKVTLSFWVKSPKTGTHIAELYDNDNARQVSKAYSITTANTWQNVTLQFPADTTGEFDNDVNNSLQITFWLMAGSNFTSGTLNTSWAGSTSADRAAGQVNVVDSTSNNFYITGVQLEVGSVATEFEHRSYGEELHLYRRYFQKWEFSANDGVVTVANWDNNTSFGIIDFSPEMRTEPTLDDGTVASGWELYEAGVIRTGTVLFLQQPSTRKAEFALTATPIGTSGHAGWVRADSAAFFWFDAEL